jgi:GNAT superfamily N-acetyltransferase
MPVAFHLAHPEDLTELVAMMKELQADDPWSCPFDERLASNAMDELLRNPSLGCVWTIAASQTNGSQTIGYIVMAFDYSLEYRGKGAWVDEFFIRPAHRGQGIGAQALEFFAEQARQLGVTVVHLEVNRGNPAIELYRRAGFEDHQRYLMTKWIVEKP